MRALAATQEARTRDPRAARARPPARPAPPCSWGGYFTSPFPGDLVPQNPGILIGMQGQLLALLPGACPATAAELARQLAGASFETAPELGALQLYPGSIQVGVAAVPGAVLRPGCCGAAGLCAPSPEC